MINSFRTFRDRQLATKHHFWCVENNNGFWFKCSLISLVHNVCFFLAVRSRLTICRFNCACQLLWFLFWVRLFSWIVKRMIPKIIKWLKVFENFLCFKLCCFELIHNARTCECAHTNESPLKTNHWFFFGRSGFWGAVLSKICYPKFEQLVYILDECRKGMYNIRDVLGEDWSQSRGSIFAQIPEKRNS